MANQAQYRFLPWTRRGLVAELPPVAVNATLPSRAKLAVGVTVTNLPADGNPTGIDLALYGPGDILGIDLRLIIRTSPRAGSTNVEPNYFTAIEFDPPDFPWMFTPAGADGSHRLLPWLVLLVLDTARVRAPQVDRTRPLPTIQIPAEVAAQELPDLSESWAWAHTQALVADDTPNQQLPAEFETRPDLNVSRLIAPRRLAPNRSYIACLVPAFSAGVTRGLGGAPDPQQPLAPAWGASPGEVQLPVYFHWEFATGPLGDFESLARKLKPFASPDSVGVISMYMGDGNPLIPPIPPDEERATTLMDGALRAPSRASGRLAEIDGDVQQGLERALNLPAEILAGGPPDATPVLGPPIYGQWHAKQHTVNPSNPRWLRELNLDPRGRVAAGLGAEVVRRNQELFMQEAWAQIGEILKANSWLNWGRLSLEANRYAYNRHFRDLSADRLLQMTVLLQSRTLHGGVTVRRAVRESSLPNAVADPALRRLVSPQRPALKTTVRRLQLENRLSPTFASVGRSTLVTSLARGRVDVDPTRFTPDGLTGSVTLDKLTVPEGGMLDLGEIGLPLRIAAARVRDYQSQVRDVRHIDFQANPPQIEVRANLRTTGLVTRTHVANVAALDLLGDEQTVQSASPIRLLDTLLESAAANPSAKGILVTLDESRSPFFNALEVNRDGGVFIRTTSTTTRTVGTLDMALLTEGVQGLSAVLSDLPAGTFDRRGSHRLEIGAGASGELQLRGSAHFPIDGPGRFGAGSVRPVVPIGPPPVEAETPPLSNTVPMPVTDALAITTFETTLRELLADTVLNQPAATGTLRPFDLGAVAGTILKRIDPEVMVPRRMAEMVATERGRLVDAASLGIRVTPAFDRIMVAPDLPAATYQYLAEYDKERFVPGIGIIPPNSITLLETNPRFIEGFLVGLNHEMNRELLWRAYPTDQRGSPFRFFWEWVDGVADIEPIHTWHAGRLLGSNSRGAGGGGQIVLLVRGELVKRYPNAVMLAWKATPDGNRLIDNPLPAQLKSPVFQGKLDPDIIFAGFDLTDQEIPRDGGWFFLVQEQPTEPRFGFDEPDGAPGPLTGWAGASWAHTGVAAGGYLRLQGSPLNGRSFGGLTLGSNAAHHAAITLQQPMRVAVHGRHLVR